MTRLTRLALAATFVAGFLAAASARAAEDVSGDWDFTVDIGGQQGTPSFTFKQDGEKLTGKYKGQFGEAELKGTVKGTEIEFTFEIEGGGKVVYKGTIDKDTMKGKADYAGQAEGTWTAKKKAA
jgi:hypothetical protein